VVFGEQEIREFRAAGLPGKAGDERAVAVGFAARWVSPELRASDSDALRRHVPRLARAWLTGADAAPAPAENHVKPLQTNVDQANILVYRRPKGESHRAVMQTCGDDANRSPLDGLPVMSDLDGVPNQAKPTTMPERPTKGAKIGSRLRARTNKLSDTARESTRLRGLQLIYGNGSGHKVHAPSR